MKIMKNNNYLKLLLALVFICSLNSLTIGQNNNQNFKRGYGFGNHAQADMEALSQTASWWYNWWHQPDGQNNIIDVYQDFEMEFVPQAWNAGFNETAMRAYLDNHPDVKYIMGYNEPNFHAQANLSPAQAAANWHKIEKVADDYNLKIVGPALNYSPDAPYHSPFDWMDEWLEECDKIGGCRFDYVNVHSYMNTVGALEWYLGEWERYGKPIWLTEFCAWDGIETTATPAYQQNFMREALAMLDAKPTVYRYAWFVARSTGIPYNSLLGSVPGQLTDLGRIFTDQNAAPENKDVTLRVVDRTLGEVSNSAAWSNESVYCWLGNTQSWAGENNMPDGTMQGDWIGMYDGLEGGRLIKTATEWIWSYTFKPVAGYSYNWNPGVWTNVGRTENSFQYLYEERNLEFSVDNNGKATGELTLIIENTNKATPTGEYTTTGINGLADISNQVFIAPNPATDEVHIFSPFQIKSVSIYTQDGILMFSKKTQGTLSVKELSLGHYIMQITSIHDQLAVKKLVIRR